MYILFHLFGNNKPWCLVKVKIQHWVPCVCNLPKLHPSFQPTGGRLSVRASEENKAKIEYYNIWLRSSPPLDGCRCDVLLRLQPLPIIIPDLGKQVEVCHTPGGALQGEDQPQLHVWHPSQENPWVQEAASQLPAHHHLLQPWVRTIFAFKASKLLSHPADIYRSVHM